MISPNRIFNRIAERPSSLLVDVGYNSPLPCESTHSHHLIPHEVWDRIAKDHPTAELMAGTRNNPRNLMELPSTEAGALISGLALHNGSHPGYTKEVFRKVDELELAYNAHKLACDPHAEALFVQGLLAMEDDLRKSLDRRTLPHPQLMLSSKDPLANSVTPDVRAEAERLEQAVGMVSTDPRSAYPSSSTANTNCDAAKAVTVEQLQEFSARIRAQAWEGAGIAPPQQDEPETFKERLVRTAEEHPFHAAMAGVGLVMMSGAAVLAAPEVITTGAVANTYARARPLMSMGAGAH